MSLRFEREDGGLLLVGPFSAHVKLARRTEAERLRDERPAAQLRAMGVESDQP